jgi:hypothetical protein
MSRKLFALALGALILGVWGQSSRVRADEPVVVIQAGGQSCGQGGCCRDRGCDHEGVCVPITQTKKVEKRCYTDKCEQFCLPRCGGLFSGGCGGCGDGCDHGACHECGHVCVKKYLIVKIKQEEQCVPACKVEQGCAHDGCAAPAIIQPVPAKPMPAVKPTAAVLPGQPAMQVLEYRALPKK